MNKRRIAIICLLLIMVMAVGGVLAFMTDTAEVKNTFTVGKVDIMLDETRVDMYGDPVDDAGNAVTDTAEYVRVETGNAYHLIPGASYMKDPAVTVKAGSEKSYVRMILTVTNASVLGELMSTNNLSDYQSLLAGWSDAWVYHGYTEDTVKDTISFEFRYKNAVDGYVGSTHEKEDRRLEPLFTELVIPGSVTSEQLAKLNGDFDFDGVTDDGKAPVEMIITAHAIQVTGFEPEITDDMTQAQKAEAWQKAVAAAWAAFDEQISDESAIGSEDGNDETGSDEGGETGSDNKDEAAN